MKKIIAALFFLSSFSLNACYQSFVIKKVYVIAQSILKRIDKNPTDFSQVEKNYTISIFLDEYKKGCLSCRCEADLNYFDAIVKLEQHLLKHNKL